MEVITFRPPPLNCTLFVSGLPVDMKREEKWRALQDAFSSYGLLYSVQLPSNEELDYGFVRYYSPQSALSAQRELHRKLIVGGRDIKVQMSTGPSSSPHSAPSERRLHISRCHQLANHYLGFNGWSLKLKERSKTVNSEGEQVYHCEAVLCVRGWGVECEGVGETSVSLEGMESVAVATGVAQKRSYQQACECAFSQLVLVVDPGGQLSVHTLARDGTAAGIDGPAVNIVETEVTEHKSRGQSQ